MHTYLCFNSTTSVTNRAVELEFRDAEHGGCFYKLMLFSQSGLDVI